MKNSIYNNPLVRDLVRLALLEDLGPDGEDITSDLLFDRRKKGEAEIRAKEPLIFCGYPVIEEVFRQVDPAVSLQAMVTEGAELTGPRKVVRLEGPAVSLLRGERVALNFAQRMSGVATMTHRYTAALKGSPVQLLDTRKTLPGHRVTDKYAVKCGGGDNHRMGLYDMMMIKDNHKRAAGGLTEAIARAQVLRRKGIILEVEVETIEEAREAAMAGCDIIMLDNMDNHSIASCSTMIRSLAPHTKIEVSGGIILERLPDLGKLDIDFISTGAVTHSAVAVDLSMEMDF